MSGVIPQETSHGVVVDETQLRRIKPKAPAQKVANATSELVSGDCA